MKVAIAGATGRMGRTLIEGVLKDRELKLAAALELAGHAAIGKDAGELAGAPCGTKVSDDIDAAVGASDIVIDFTRPGGALAHLNACVRLGKRMVLGTTGFTKAQMAGITASAKRIPVVMAPNFAVGVNVLFKLAGE